MSGGNAAIIAARKARQELLSLAAERLMPARRADAGRRCCPCERRAGTPQHLAELARQHIWRHGGGGIQVTGTWDPKTVMHDDKLYGNIAAAYSYAAQAVEVEVDIETGQVRVIDSYVADDCGKALNPIAIHGQTNGATVQAIGWTLYEQLHYEGGRLANGNFADYNMATADAVPMLRGGLVESNDPNGPMAPRVPARPPSCQAHQPSPTPSMTRLACASPICPSPRKKCWLHARQAAARSKPCVNLILRSPAR
jgi:CO/xanthine dehydrogenase Mo-binding subunit